MEDERVAYRILVRRPDGKRPLERPRRRWEDNIKRIFKMWDEEAWTELVWFRIGAGGGLLYMW
jgi:hypothetical protein